MANLQEKIASMCKSATFVTDTEWLEVNVADADWHSLAKSLKEDPETSMDQLVALIGMDWTETLGCMYYLHSTAHNTQIAVKVETADHENPMLHSVSDLWDVANLYEREVYDYYGIIFINHPDMRRLFLRNDWVGYPLRKDYDLSPETNPVRLDHEAVEDTTVSYQEQPDGTIVKKEIPVFLHLLLAFMLFFTCNIVLFSITFYCISPLFKIYMQFGICPVIFPADFQRTLLSGDCHLCTFRKCLMGIPHTD